MRPPARLLSGEIMSDDLGQRLAAPFPPDRLGWKPQAAKGNRALAVAYIDARDVMDRLDEVVGVAGWEDEYQPDGHGNVVCRLTVHLPDGRKVTKSDVGGESEQPDGWDRTKAAFSDALKRAAVKFGIGRYLYSLPAVWCDYDPQKKQFSQTPQLPAWAVPKVSSQQRPAQQQQHQPTSQTAQQPVKRPAPKTPLELWQRMGDSESPRSGDELADWLASVDNALVAMSPEYKAGEVFAKVRDYLQLAPNAVFTAVAGQALAGAWGNAKQTVKVVADRTQAQPVGR